MCICASHELAAQLSQILVSHRQLLLLLEVRLGQLLKAKGDLAGAEPLYRRALEGQEEALGPTHPSTLATVGNLAILLAARGAAAAAEERGPVSTM